MTTPPIRRTSAAQLATSARGQVRTPSSGPSEVWQARIGHEFADQLRADAVVLGLDGTTDIVKSALKLLHRKAAEERMAQSVEEFYGDAVPPLPLGVAAANVDT